MIGKGSRGDPDFPSPLHPGTLMGFPLGYRDTDRFMSPPPTHMEREWPNKSCYQQYLVIPWNGGKAYPPWFETAALNLGLFVIWPVAPQSTHKS